MLPLLAWTITVDPLTTVLGFVHLQVEHRLGGHASLYAGPSLKLFDSPLGIAGGPYKGFGVEAGLRVFPWGAAPRGPWAMARAVIADVVPEPGRFGDTEWDLRQPGPQPGGYASLLVGYTGVIPVSRGVQGGLALSGGLGVSWFDYGTIHGVLPAAHTNIGWAF